jgi:peptidoglycan hydrolase-like protein with peptidoglycan-binding domain
MVEIFPPKPNFAPLVSNDERAKIFGRFKFRPDPSPGNAEGIEILGDWREKNILWVPIPQMAAKKLGEGRQGGMYFHRLGVQQLLGMWNSWEQAGLLDRVVEFDGSFAPRFVRGSHTNLSNHSFGCAFDINYEGNELGHEPALVGRPGSVRELVPIANAWGFYWGGHYNNRKDGMHFELTVPGMDGSAYRYYPPTVVVGGNPILKRGSKGDAVKKLQGLLGIPADGDFGFITEREVKDFQTRSNLKPVDGEVGEDTWAELGKDYNAARVGYCPNVMASVFGGSSETEKSAYDGHRIGTTERVVALPWRFSGKRPSVKITNRMTGQTATAMPEDVGPWNGITKAKSDPYLLKGIRPQAESGRDLNGRRTNLAGVDLSPALAHAIGITGMGRVDVELLG